MCRTYKGYSNESRLHMRVKALHTKILELKDPAKAAKDATISLVDSLGLVSLEDEDTRMWTWWGWGDWTEHMQHKTMTHLLGFDTST